MLLNEKETSVIKELQTQEKSCIEKYKRYSQEAKDPVLKDLFHKLHQEEQKHYDSLGEILSGRIPSCDCNDSAGKNYQPSATYRGESEDKTSDCFLATDCIGTEKMVSSEYNGDVFRFSNSDIRKLLADIQIEEQNHAEMLYKYKMVNAMA
jgi:rubrerythrin